MCRHIKQHMVRLYHRLYYGPLNSARLFRLRRYLTVLPPSPPLVCRKYRFIYHPIPKTGCTTIRSLIFEAEGLAVPSDDERVHDKKLTEINAPAPHFNGYAAFEDYFKFAFVRNPWARLVSCYQNKVLAPRPAMFDSFACCYPGVRFDRMSFAQFVRFICRVPDDLCEPHFKSQSAFFDAGAMDFIGRAERFPDDLAQVIDQVGGNDALHKWCVTQRMQSHDSTHYTDFYDAKTRRLVAGKYRNDVERFGYRFGD